MSDNDTISLNPLDFISGENAIKVIELITKGYQVTSFIGDRTDIDPSYHEEVSLWSYRWQTNITVSRGEVRVACKLGAGHTIWHVEDIPEELEKREGDVIGEHGYVERTQ